MGKAKWNWKRKLCVFAGTALGAAALAVPVVGPITAAAVVKLVLVGAGAGLLGVAAPTPGGKRRDEPTDDEPVTKTERIP